MLDFAIGLYYNNIAYYNIYDNGGIVMYGYKIKQDNGKYYFKLYPGNKPNQYIGESRRYNKKEDCEKH